MNWNIKSAIFVVLLLLSVCELKAQIYKYQAYCFSYTYKDDNGGWSGWSDWEDSNRQIVFNMDENIIVVYSDIIQKYDIDEYEVIDEVEFGGTSVAFECVDNRGFQCRVRLWSKIDGNLQLYVVYGDMMWVYGIRKK